jgi:drug/metabolite transporter (DMT)-like permease
MKKQFGNYARSIAIMNTAIVYILISVVGGAIGQILLKHGMNQMGPVTLSSNQFLSIIWQMGTNLYVFVGLGIYVLSVIFWLAALSRVDLSYAYPFASLSYLVMLTASWGIFDEKISLMRILGTCVVCIGVLLISRS